MLCGYFDPVLPIPLNFSNSPQTVTSRTTVGSRAFPSVWKVMMQIVRVFVQGSLSQVHNESFIYFYVHQIK